jgi:hypothetical protein
MDAREGNDRLAQQAERLQFVSRVPMLCECSTPGCHTLVMIHLRDYYEIRRDPDSFITAPGHEVEGAELQREGPDYTIRRAS